MKTRVFIDGSEGTTGLRIAQRLAERDDVQLMQISPELRKDVGERARLMSQSDIVFLCLPDDAARVAAKTALQAGARVIDASTAHRTDPEWVYGFPELGYRDRIRSSSRVAVPGCHAGGFLALITPLVRLSVIPADAQISCFSLTGYSGGGKKMIAQYEDPSREPILDAPRCYALGQTHKHLPEMQAISGLETPPHFSPIVSDYYSGMLVAVPLFCEQFGVTCKQIEKIYESFYTDGVVSVTDGAGFDASGALMSGRDDMKIAVCGNDVRATVYASFDNLGKGASGAAVQCFNLMCGKDEKYSLVTGD